MTPRLPLAGDCETIPPLYGHAVGVTGDRRSEELAAHLQFLGATIVHGPMIHTRPVTADNTELRRGTAAVIDRPPDYLLATTGIGIRSWFNAAASWGQRAELRASLSRTKILARGPKAGGAVHEAGLDVWRTEPAASTDAMVETLLREPIAGAHVAIQLPGSPLPHVVEHLEAAGATVTAVAVYDWVWPDDLTAPRRLLQAVVAGRVSVVTFTSRPAVRNFVSLAAVEGLEAQVCVALAGPVHPVCVGALTAEEVHALTGATAVTPEEPMLGMLVQAVAETVRRDGHHHVLLGNGSHAVLQGRHVRVGETAVTLSEREAAVLRRLVTRPRRTVSRDDLLQTVWGSAAVDASALETTIARLRRRLRHTGLGIVTINGRGYLLGGEVVPCPVDHPVGDLALSG